MDYRKKLEETRKELARVQANGIKLAELEALLKKELAESKNISETDTLKLFVKMQEAADEIHQKYEERLREIDAGIALPTENTYHRADFAGIGVVAVLAFMLCYVTWHWVANVRLDNSGAQILLQEFVDQSPEFSGEVTRVELGNEFCTQATGGNSCQARVTFQLDGRLMTGECSYGIGGRSSRRCYFE